MKIKVFLIVGARPNFMKIAPIYSQMLLHPKSFEPIIVHTGQHYDENMSKIFFSDLELPHPDIYLGVGSGSHAEQTAEIMKRFEPQLLEHKPDLVMVVGDVNSTIACALTAIKSRIPSPHLSELWQQYENDLQSIKTDLALISAHKMRCRSHEAPIIAHVEAGLRSFDFNMPEEINRVETDVLSDILFTTSSGDDSNLIEEGIDPRKIFCVGNVMIDSLQNFLTKAAKSIILDKLNRDNRARHHAPLKGGDFALATLHRPGNVDDPAMLTEILSALIRVSADLPIIFPMHPRTRKLLSKLNTNFQQQLSASNVVITAPVGYLDFLHLQTKARLVLTDSGGVQVETSYLGVPCLTLRPNTEWLITIREGTNKLVPLNNEAIVSAAKTALKKKEWHPANIQYWDGQAAERIVNSLKQIFHLQ